MSAPLRAVIGIPFGSVMGGAERVLWDLLRARERAGLEPHVVCFRDGPFVDDVAALGVPVTVIDPGRFRHPWRLAAAVLRLARLLREVRPDLCVSWLPRVQTVMAPAAVLAGLGRRVVFVQHELADGHWLARLAVALPCRWVIAASTPGAEATRSLWPHRDSSVVRPGIHPPAPPTEPVDVPRGRPVVGAVGRVVRLKNLDRLIAAVALLRDRGTEVTLLVVGGEAHGVDRGHEAELRSLVHRLGLGDHVRFCGHVPDAAGHLAAMDLLVSASEREGFGIVLLEAMALGVPVVAVARGGSLDIVRDGESGLLVPTASAEGLADAIGQVVSDRALRERMAAAGRARFVSCFTVDRMVDEMGAELRAVADECVAPRG